MARIVTKYGKYSFQQVVHCAVILIDFVSLQNHSNTEWYFLMLIFRCTCKLPDAIVLLSNQHLAWDRKSESKKKKG